MSVVWATVHIEDIKTTFDCLCPPDVTEEEEGDEGEPEDGQGQGDQGAQPGGGGPGDHLGQQAAQQVANVEHEEAADWHKIPEQGMIMGLLSCHINFSPLPGGVGAGCLGQAVIAGEHSEGDEEI